MAIDKYILNPKWKGSPEQREEIDRYVSSTPGPPFSRYYERMSYLPDEYDLEIPQAGAWILVKEPPETEYTVPALSLWYALPEWRKTGRDFNQHLAHILTPRGSLFLYPHEYSIVKDIGRYLEYPADHTHVHYLGGEGLAPDKLFYLRSRGLGKAQATKMLLGEVKSPNVAFITLHPAYARLLLSKELPDPRRNAVGPEEWLGENENDESQTQSEVAAGESRNRGPVPGLGRRPGERARTTGKKGTRCKKAKSENTDPETP